MERKRRQYRKITLDAKIVAAQDKILQKKEKYDLALKKLEKLLEKYEEQRKSELLLAISTSHRSHEEIMAFLRG